MIEAQSREEGFRIALDILTARTGDVTAGDGDVTAGDGILGLSNLAAVNRKSHTHRLLGRTPTYRPRHPRWQSGKIPY